jgi:hypothetical protein
MLGRVAMTQPTGEIITRPTLARLTDLGRQIQALLLDASIEDKETLATALQHIEGDWLTKVENCGHIIRDFDYLIENFDAEIDKLRAHKKALENRQAWLLDYLMFNMVEKGEDKLQFPLVSVSIVKNPPSVEILDEKMIPSSYTTIKTEITINKKPIADDLKKGINVPGARLITDRKRVQVRW